MSKKGVSLNVFGKLNNIEIVEKNIPKKRYNPYSQDEQENINHDEEEIGIEQNINPQNNNINLLYSNVINAIMGNLNANNDEILNNI